LPARKISRKPHYEVEAVENVMLVDVVLIDVVLVDVELDDVELEDAGLRAARHPVVSPSRRPVC
jgi:hypothetical protein